MSKLDRLVSELADALATEKYRAAWSLAADIRDHLADDRERRVRELAREWIGNCSYRTVQIAIRDAAAFIDALDAAEVPKKGGE